jgi:hypothetical protein
VIVAIQPAYGDAWTRRQFVATLDRPVPFTERRYGRHLTRAELSALTDLHPEGHAAWWGGTRSQAAKISQLQRGDLVLLTGQRHIRGVGQIGVVLDNGDFAHALWGSHPRRCSFEIAYSLACFRRVAVPYAVLQSALGTSQRDNFQGLRLLRDRQRVDAVRDVLEHEAMRPAELSWP